MEGGGNTPACFHCSRGEGGNSPACFHCSRGGGGGIHLHVFTAPNHIFRKFRHQLYSAGKECLVNHSQIRINKKWTINKNEIKQVEISHDARILFWKTIGQIRDPRLRSHFHVLLK